MEIGDLKQSIKTLKHAQDQAFSAAKAALHHANAEAIKRQEAQHQERIEALETAFRLQVETAVHHLETEAKQQEPLLDSYAKQMGESLSKTFHLSISEVA